MTYSATPILPLDTTSVADSDVQLAAVLWDMDGTLVETEPYWIAAETELVAAHGGTWTEQHGAALIGQDVQSSAIVLQDYGVKLEADEIVAQLTESVLRSIQLSLSWRPGVLSLLQSIHRAGIKTALVTSSRRVIAKAVAASLPSSNFDVVVSGDDVVSFKPDPEPYLLAARMLGVQPAHCVAIEDSPIGLSSAIRAGTQAIGVPYLTALDIKGRWTRWHTLESHDLAELQRLVRAANFAEPTGG